MKTTIAAHTEFQKFKVSLLCLIFLTGLSPWCRSDVTVAPNGLENIEGNSANLAPFFIENTSARFTGMRYQQVYNASEFASFEPEGGRITGLWFRGDRDFGGPGNFITNIQINLSTTPRSADNLSMIFSENVGLDDLVVVGPGPLDVRGASGGNPSPFTIKFDLETPFDYNPSAGNLLLDVRNYTGGAFNPVQFQAFDAQDSVGDGISRVYAQSVDALMADDISLSSLGLITQFEYTPIPEPSSLALIGLFGVACAGWAWGRGSPRKRMGGPFQAKPKNPGEPNRAS